MTTLLTSCPACWHLHDEQYPCTERGCFCLVCLACGGNKCAGCKETGQR